MTSKKLLSFYLGLAISVGCIQGCGGASENQSPLSPIASIGAQAFVDQTLSASGRQSCQPAMHQRQAIQQLTHWQSNLEELILTYRGYVTHRHSVTWLKTPHFILTKRARQQVASFGMAEQIHSRSRLRDLCWVQEKWPIQTKLLLLRKLPNLAGQMISKKFSAQTYFKT